MRVARDGEISVMFCVVNLHYPIIVRVIITRLARMIDGLTQFATALRKLVTVTQLNQPTLAKLIFPRKVAVA